MTPIDLLRDYINRGWQLIPISRTTKAPIIDNWQSSSLSAQELEVFLSDGRANVGVVLGDPSGGLTDVDLDDPVAAAIAPRLLPPTPCVFGRKSKPRSHYFYVCPELVPYLKARDPSGGCLFELRGDGRQTMVPPSIHPSGEPVEFDSYGPPATVELSVLQKACTLLAVSTILVKHWPDRGSRHETYLALSGSLLLSGWGLEDVITVVEIIAERTGADNPKYKPQIVRDTWETIQRGDHPTNWRQLSELLGASVARALRRWAPQLSGTMSSSNTSKIPVDVGVDIHQLLLRCWEILEQTNSPPEVFQHAGLLVRVEEVRGDLVLAPIDDVRLHNILTSKIEFYRQTDTRIPCQPPANLTSKLLADSSLPGRRKWVPLIDRVVNHPVIVQGEDGEYRLLTQKGYHRESRTYLTTDWDPKIGEGDVDEARRVIDDLLVDFPFDGEAARAHAVALLIQPFVRPLIPGSTPMYFIVAPVQGTGKTLLGKVLLYPSLGREPLTNPFPEDEVEMVKYLTSKLVRDRRVVFFDNVIRMPDIPSLSAAITGPGFESRVLGSSSSVIVHPPDTWVGTGNNSVIHADMSRRIVPIRLVANVENPSRRTDFVHPDILGYVRENRERVVRAVCILAMHGLQSPPTNHRLGSFERWSSLMGRIVTGIGFSGFLEGLPESTDVDSPRTFILLWWHRFGSSPVFVRDLVDLANVSLPSRDEWTPRRLSNQIARFRDLVLCGVRVTHGGKYIGTDRWALVPTGVEPTPERDPSLVESFINQQTQRRDPQIIITQKRGEG